MKRITSLLLCLLMVLTLTIPAFATEDGVVGDGAVVGPIEPPAPPAEPTTPPTQPTNPPTEPTTAPTQPPECTDHTWNGGTVSTAATCKTEGTMLYTCTACGDSFTDSHTELADHTFGDWVLTIAPTYLNTGLETRTCTHCGLGEYRLTDPLGNPFTDVPDGAAIHIHIIAVGELNTGNAAFIDVVVDDLHIFAALANDANGAAAKQAHAHSFIRRLPQGYDTVIGPEGGLSQGQRQLLCIARIMLTLPPMLILDEATSSVDTRTERLIEVGMDSIMEERTVFVIAHRLSTVRNSERIIVLEKGEIIEEGDHQSLIDLGGKYYQLYTGTFEME